MANQWVKNIGKKNYFLDISSIGINDTGLQSKKLKIPLYKY